jgi:hypothetical protein
MPADIDRGIPEQVTISVAALAAWEHLKQQPD